MTQQERIRDRVLDVLQSEFGAVDLSVSLIALSLAMECIALGCVIDRGDNAVPVLMDIFGEAAQRAQHTKSLLQPAVGRA